MLGFGENLPTDGYLLPRDEGEFIQIDTNSKSEKQLLFAHRARAWSTLWRPTLGVTSSQGYLATAFDLTPFGWSEHTKDKNYSRALQAERIIGLLEELGTKPIGVAH